ncbi:MAG: hypothetical protein AAFX50_07755 [Acidobacteriota bacterium]
MPEQVDLSQISPDLQTALVGVRSNQEEAAKFVADPQAYLEAKGVDTEGLNMHTGELTDAELEQVAGGRQIAADAISICGSVGCIICGTIGGDL